MRFSQGGQVSRQCHHRHACLADSSSVLPHRDSGAVAVTCCVFLVIIFIMVMLGVRKPGGRVLYYLVAVAFITGIIMMSTAFAATTAYQNLIGNLFSTFQLCASSHLADIHR